MNTVELDRVLTQAPSAAGFAEIVRVLEAWPDADLASAIAKAATSLQSWPDLAREAPSDAWQAIQQGEPPPPWWSLVRHVRLAEGETLDLGSALTPLTSVEARGVRVDPSPLHEAHHLRSLDLTANEEVLSLDFLAGTPRLERLVLSNVELLPDLAPIGQLPALHTLNLSQNPNLLEIAPLATLSTLRWLDLSGDLFLADLEPLAALSSLETLLLSGCDSLSNIDVVERLPCLRWLFALDLPLLSDIRALASTKLERLQIGGRSIVDGAPLAKISSLVELTLAGMPHLRDFRFLHALRQLQRLEILACDAPLPLLDMPALASLLIVDCPNVQDLHSVVGLQSLRVLSLSGLAITDLTPLTALPRLERLLLTSCREIRDLSPLARVPLQQLDLVDCVPELDTTPLPAGCRIVR